MGEALQGSEEALLDEKCFLALRYYFQPFWGQSWRHIGANTGRKGCPGGSGNGHFKILRNWSPKRHPRARFHSPKLMRCGVRFFGPPMAPCRFPLVPFWLPFGFLWFPLISLWLPFGFLLASFGFPLASLWFLWFPFAFPLVSFGFPSVSFGFLSFPFWLPFGFLWLPVVSRLLLFGSFWLPFGFL